MEDNGDSGEPKGKSPETSMAEKSPSIGSFDGRPRRLTETGGHILFAPDPLEHIGHGEVVAPPNLTRTFSRQSRFSSYSAASDEEHERARRVTSRKTVELHTRLPTGIVLWHFSNSQRIGL